MLVLSCRHVITMRDRTSRTTHTPYIAPGLPSGRLPAARTCRTRSRVKARPASDWPRTCQSGWRRRRATARHVRRQNTPQCNNVITAQHSTAHDAPAAASARRTAASVESRTADNSPSRARPDSSRWRLALRSYVRAITTDHITLLPLLRSYRWLPPSRCSYNTARSIGARRVAGLCRDDVRTQRV
jgi:hypothetical protein